MDFKGLRQVIDNGLIVTRFFSIKTLMFTAKFKCLWKDSKVYGIIEKYS